MHDHPAPGGVVRPDSEQIELLSAGVDIGSATSQFSISRLTLRRRGLALSTRFDVVRREQLGPVQRIFTPYMRSGEIDAAAVRSFIEQNFHAAGLVPADVDTGVVLLTGEAARRVNAAALGAAVARTSGQFVCAAAGHDMEGRLAAHGSGAVDRSRAAGTTVLNVDVGGGTTKITEVDNGRVVSTYAVHVGGRLAAFEQGRIVRLEEQGRRLAGEAGLSWNLGDAVHAEDVERLGAHMANVIASFLAPDDTHEEAGLRPHALTPPSPPPPVRTEIVLSGGVAAFVRDGETDWTSDIGAALGRNLRSVLRATDRWPQTTIPTSASEATVLGASRHTVQLSGNTSFITPGSLPLRNLRIVTPPLDLSGPFDAPTVESAVETQAESIRAAQAVSGCAMAFAWGGEPEFGRLDAFTQGLAAAAGRLLREGEPLVVLLDGDVARLCGHLLATRGLERPVVVVDGLQVDPLDFVDLGPVLNPARTIPVTVKSFVF